MSQISVRGEKGENPTVNSKSFLLAFGRGRLPGGPHPTPPGWGSSPPDERAQRTYSGIWSLPPPLKHSNDIYSRISPSTCLEVLTKEKGVSHRWPESEQKNECVGFFGHAGWKRWTLFPCLVQDRTTLGSFAR